MIQIAAIPPALTDVMYPLVEHHFERVIEKAPNEISHETIKANLTSGNQMLITMSDGSEVVAAAVVNKYVFETGYSVLIIPILGGSRMDEWLDRFIDMTQAIARDLGCAEVRAIGREGWERKLHSRGWQKVHSIVGVPVKQTAEET